MSAPATAPAPPRFPRAAFILLLLGGCSIAFAPIFVRLSPVEPTATAFWRLFLALPFIAVARAIVKPDDPAQPLRWGLLIWPGLFFAGDLAVWHWCIKFTSVTNSTLLPNMAPIFVTALAWLLYRERITPLFLVGLAVAFAGMMLLVGRSFQISMQTFNGDLLGVATAMFYAGYQLSVKRLRNIYATLTVMYFMCLVGSAALLALTLLSGEELFWRGGPGAAGWLVLLGLALVSHIGGQGLIVYAMGKLPASFASATLLIQPLVATIAGWLILGEALSVVQAVGGAVILSGIVIVRHASFR